MFVNVSNFDFSYWKPFSIELVFIEIYAANENTTNGTEVNGEKKLDPRIVGGTKAIKGQFRGIVSDELL